MIFLGEYIPIVLDLMNDSFEHDGHNQSVAAQNSSAILSLAGNLLAKEDTAQENVRDLVARIECDKAVKDLLEKQLSEKEAAFAQLQESIEARVQEAVSATEKLNAGLKARVVELVREKEEAESTCEQLLEKDNAKRAEVLELQQKLSNSIEDLEQLKCQVSGMSWKMECAYQIGLPLKELLPGRLTRPKQVWIKLRQSVRLKERSCQKRSSHWQRNLLVRRRSLRNSQPGRKQWRRV